MNQIAIIDDSEINLTLFRALVGRISGCESQTFQSSSKGLAWCVEHTPELIIVDYMMPEMDGLEFIRRLRGVPGRTDVPVLMITANIDKEVRYEALQNGATDFLNKPVDRIEFDARVRNMLALGESRRHLADRAAWLAEEVRKATAAVHQREKELLFRMSRAAEFRDPETGAHILRMSHSACLIAERLGLPTAEQALILQASPMHDIGKLGVPDHILLKPGPLDAEELVVMRRHASIGYELMKDSDSLVLQAAATIAIAHHERFDGEGYPYRVAGEAIPLYGRIVAVADVFDALTSFRPYKPAWSIEASLGYINGNRGRHFDPACVDAFHKALDDILAVRAEFRDEDCSKKQVVQ